MPLLKKDAQLQVSKPLPNGAAIVTTSGIKLNNPAGYDFDDAELLIEAPALTAAQLPNTQTMTYTVEHDTDPAFGTAVVLHQSALMQTGAGGVGAAATQQRIALPSDVKNYIRVKATNSGIGNASTVSVTASLVL